MTATDITLRVGILVLDRGYNCNRTTDIVDTLTLLNANIELVIAFTLDIYLLIMTPVSANSFGM